MINPVRWTENRKNKSKHTRKILPGQPPKIPFHQIWGSNGRVSEAYYITSMPSMSAQTGRIKEPGTLTERRWADLNEEESS
jgi:hypothetical protein